MRTDENKLSSIISDIPEKQRILYIDNLKGLAILLVVLGHCIQFTNSNYDNNIVFKYIYSFHMPLFMFLSGFVSYKKNFANNFCIRRFKQLMVPFFSWAILSSVINWNVFLPFQIILKPDKGLWFLWVLFFINIFVFICYKIQKKIVIPIEILFIILAAVLILLMLTLKFKYLGFQFIAWYFPFFISGFLLKKHYDII